MRIHTPIWHDDFTTAMSFDIYAWLPRAVLPEGEVKYLSAASGSTMSTEGGSLGYVAWNGALVTGVVVGRYDPWPYPYGYFPSHFAVPMSADQGVSLTAVFDRPLTTGAPWIYMEIANRSSSLTGPWVIYDWGLEDVNASNGETDFVETAGAQTVRLTVFGGRAYLELDGVLSAEIAVGEYEGWAPMDSFQIYVRDARLDSFTISRVTEGEPANFWTNYVNTAERRL